MSGPWSNQLISVLIVSTVPGFSGIFVYNGPPALGNLIASIAAAAGTDLEGNIYPAAIESTAYTSGKDTMRVILGDQNFTGKTGQVGVGVTFNDLQNPANIPPSISGQTVSGTPPPELDFTSGRPTSIAPQALMTLTTSGQSNLPALVCATDLVGADTFVLELIGGAGTPLAVTSEAQLWASNEANQVLLHTNTGINFTQLANQPPAPGASTGTLYMDKGGYFSVISAADLVQSISGSSRSALNLHTVTAAALTNLADVTQMYPANDPVIGAIYEMEAWGTAVWGSTVQALTFQMTLGGVSFNTIAIASTAFVASANVNWYAKATFKCLTTGSSGTFSGVLNGQVNVPAGGLLPGTGVSDTVPFTRTVGAGGITVSTTVAQPAAIQAQWGSTTGAPTITAISGNGPKRIA